MKLPIYETCSWTMLPCQSEQRGKKVRHEMRKKLSNQLMDYGAMSECATWKKYDVTCDETNQKSKSTAWLDDQKYIQHDPVS